MRATNAPLFFSEINLISSLIILNVSQDPKIRQIIMQ